MNGLPANTNRELQNLLKEGLTMEQACNCLGLDMEAGSLAIASMADNRGRGRVTSLGELVERFKPEAVQILMEIAQHSERDADRVKACQILLEGKGVMPEVNAAAASVLIERFKDMRRAVLTIDVPDDEVISMGK